MLSSMYKTTMATEKALEQVPELEEFPQGASYGYKELVCTWVRQDDG